MELEMRYFVLKLDGETNGYKLAQKLLEKYVNMRYQTLPNRLLVEVIMDFQVKD